jgi:hypothetical protein
MSLFAASRLATMTTLVVTVGACSELYVEQQFRLISIGMSEERFERFFGKPWYRTLEFEIGKDKYDVHIHYGEVTHVDLTQSDGTEYYVIRGSDGGVHYIKGSKSGSDQSTWPVRLGMTLAEVEVVAKSPTSDCRVYAGDARAEYRVCFKDHRVISKKLAGVPPT